MIRIVLEELLEDVSNDEEKELLELEEAVKALEAVGVVKKEYAYLGKLVKENPAWADKMEEIIEMCEIETAQEFIEVLDKYAIMGFAE